ncbi:hypothetical protein [Fructilactobacillus lindneri]|uniref:Uncharacterized protein n=1 Tax=Fructilactobacillus lindneri DSM 20690 = JCM 11027 TaxID=1122148 RepID=A0A0R2JNN7_9LACO|nr:hypothetical protein [Fructilactobacillus lindneri]KRN78738.1 hypothetical protein IV52_GL001016 [Fructilactobacillus lindneri DSM 20690 = JCM 11027]SJZ87810.1 hypothetical protein SAMN02746042_00646 [Fructilactobacillus lindneri DSM 20690 = JCM 11027]
MENEQWLLNQITDLEKNQTSFDVKALLEATKRTVIEQTNRIEQTQAELDGRAWSPNNW